MLPYYDHKNLLDGTPALLYYYLYAHVKEAEKKFLGNVSIFFIYFNHITAPQSTEGLKSESIFDCQMTWPTGTEFQSLSRP